LLPLLCLSQADNRKIIEGEKIMIIVIFLILTAFFWGMAPIFDKIGLRGVDVLPALTFRSIVVTLFLLLATLLYNKQEALFNMDLKSAAALALSAIFAGLLGMLTYYSALTLGATSKVVPLAATYPLITALLSILILGEGVTLYRIIGTILIIVGVWFVK
jgi:transporter family protein